MFTLKQSQLVYGYGFFLTLLFANPLWAKNLNPQLRLSRCFVATYNICQFEIVRGEAAISSLISSESLRMQNVNGQESYQVKEASIRSQAGRKFLFVTGSWLRRDDQSNYKQMLTLLSRPVRKDPSKLADQGMVLRARSNTSLSTTRKNVMPAPVASAPQQQASGSWQSAEFDNSDLLSEAMDQISGFRDGPASPVIENTHEPKMQFITFDF